MYICNKKRNESTFQTNIRTSNSPRPPALLNNKQPRGALPPTLRPLEHKLIVVVATSAGLDKDGRLRTNGLLAGESNLYLCVAPGQIIITCDTRRRTVLQLRATAHIRARKKGLRGLFCIAIIPIFPGALFAPFVSGYTHTIHLHNDSTSPKLAT